MKRIAVALLLALSLVFSFGHEQALAQTQDCLKTLNTGSSTTLQVFYEDPAAFYGWSGGVITNDMYYNACGQTVTVKINAGDWQKLLNAGKLDGLRYIYKTPKESKLMVRKIAGTQPTDVKIEDFYK
jgi:hypothetical protein